MYPLDLAERQRATGHRVFVVGRAGTPLAASIGKRQIPHYLLRIKGYFPLLAARRLSKIIDAEGVHVLHIHFPRDLLLCYLASKLAERRVAKVLHKHLSVGVSKMDPLHRVLYRDLDRTVAISQFVKRNLVAHCPLGDGDVAVVECGIDFHRWNPDRANKNLLREDYGFSASTRLVGLVGRLDPRKGQGDFIQAAALLSRRHPDLRFLVVGDSPDERYKRHLFRLSHELGVGEKVVFTGHRADIRSVLGGLDLVVAPSKEESFGLVVIEAMALKKPVVVTNRGAFPEFVIDGVTGRMVEWADPQALAKAIEASVENQEESQAIAARAYELARRRFDLGAIVDELDDLYRLVMERKGLG